MVQHCGELFGGSSLSLFTFMDWRRQWHPTPMFLLGESHGWKTLVGCSPWGRKESDMAERLHFHFSLSCTGEGHGNPLQCSCLENPRNGGAWWAAFSGVAQSRTQLKRIYIYVSAVLLLGIYLNLKMLLSTELYPSHTKFAC